MVASNAKIDDAHEEKRNLSLLNRLNIAIDVANALDCLYSHCQTPIVHCDLKPSCVLLDDELIGHVGDFGLARFLLNDTQDFSSNQSSSIGVRGTIGYTPLGEYLYPFLILIVSFFPLIITIVLSMKDSFIRMHYS